MLAREFGAWPMLVRAPKKASIYGSGGSAYIDPNDVVGIYKIKGGEFDGKFLVADEKGSWTLASPDEVKQAFGFAPENAPVLKADQNLTAHIKHARAWATYLQNWQMPQYIDGLTDQNGQPVDLHKFFTDRNYAVKVISYYLTHDRKAYNVYGKLVPIKPRTNLDPSKVVDALWALYYNSRFDPDATVFGSFAPTFWFGGPNITMEKMKQLHVGGNDAFFITPPYIDERGDHHTNLDLNPVSNRASTVVYNPFTQPVKVKNVWLIYYGKSRGKSLKEALEEGIVKAEIDFYITPPDGKPVEFYITHTRADLDFPLFKELDVLNKAVYVSPGIYLVRVNGRTTLKPGEAIAPLLDPAVDPLSQGWHIEFGPDFEIQDYRIATLMATAMLYHPNPEQYLPPLPPAPEQGYWFGKKHVVSYQPTVPAVAIKQPNGTIAFANINPNKKEPGWKKQLPASARFSKYPKSAFHRRA